jgi:hypothetical protein
MTRQWADDIGAARRAIEEVPDKATISLHATEYNKQPAAPHSLEKQINSMLGREDEE